MTLEERLQEYLRPTTPGGELDTAVAGLQHVISQWLDEQSLPIPPDAKQLARLVYESESSEQLSEKERKALLPPKNCLRYFSSILFHDRLYLSPEVQVILKSTVQHLQELQEAEDEYQSGFTSDADEDKEVSPG